MIQVNLLLGLSGRSSNSYVMLDLMRLPLGILSGMGFIGAGVILRKDDLVLGVTTAATLWFVTVMGLCFGGGQIALGLIALALALFILTVLKRVEKLVKQDRSATVRLKLDASGPSDREISGEFEARGYEIVSMRIAYATETRQREATFVVRRRTRPIDVQPPPLIEEFAQRPGILNVEWSD